MAKDSVSLIPAVRSASNSVHSNAFSVWSGQAGYPGGWSDSLIRLSNQIPVVELLMGRIPPQLAAHTLVHALRQGLGQPIGEGLQHDAAIVVVGRFEPRDMFVDADTGGDRERAGDNPPGPLCAGATKSARHSWA